MTPYVISAEARADLVGIEDYTARRWGKAQVRGYIAALYDAFNRLAERPLLGRRRFDVTSELFGYKVGGHLIVYRVGVDNRIEVVRILHRAMNPRARLGSKSGSR